MPPPPPPPPPPMLLPKPTNRGGGPAPPPPPPPPSIATGAIPRRAPAPPPPPPPPCSVPGGAPKAPKPPAPPAAPKSAPKPPAPPKAMPKLGKSAKSVKKPKSIKPVTPQRDTRKIASALKRLPSKAPALPATPRGSEEVGDLDMDVDASKFPSFTMDTNDDFGLGGFTDITNTTPLHDLPTTRSSFGTAKPTSVGFTMDEPASSLPLDAGEMASATAGLRDDEGLDVPDRLTVGPGAAAARLDLQRCTIRVHKQLVERLKTNSMGPANAVTDSDECQGELWLKSRIPMRGWKKRYGSIVDHAFYGPVLFLFKFDAKGNVALQHNMMVVLADSDVRLGRNSTTKSGAYRCEFDLRTTQRRYNFAANHTMRRDYWLRNLESISQQSSSVR